jgi:hypothetical protein
MSNPCRVIIGQSVHQVSFYKTYLNHINLNIFKIMSPVVAIVYLLQTTRRGWTLHMVARSSNHMNHFC